MKVRINERITVYTHQRHENPKVSVIVPVYKVERYLTQCLNSIVNQTMEELEIIIVDEGDQDRCREIIDYFEAHDPRIVAPHQKNGGYGASCNLGIDMARGEYIAIVESDDFIEPKMYEQMYAYAKALDADIVKTPFWEYSDYTGDHLYYAAKYLAESMPWGKLFSPRDYPQQFAFHPSSWSCIFKREYLKRQNIRFMAAKGGAYVDCTFRARAILETEKMAWLDQAYYHWRVTSEGSTTNNWNLTAILKRWNEVHKYIDANKDQYDYRKIGPYMLKEEYINTFAFVRAGERQISEEEWRLIYENLSYINPEVIESAELLNYEERQFMLCLKQKIGAVSPDTGEQRISLEEINRDYEKSRAGKKLPRKLQRMRQFAIFMAEPVQLMVVFIAFFTSLSLVYIGNLDVKLYILQTGFVQALCRTTACVSFVLLIVCYACKLLKKIDFWCERIRKRHNDRARRGK